MEPRFATSFIPKQPIGQAPQKPSRLVSIFSLAALIVFLASAALALSTFLYERLLELSISRKSASLARAEEAFEPALIQELSRLDARLKVSRELLNGHVALSAFFELLGRLTLKSVRFTTFGYSLSADGTPTATMRGEAESFSAIALQSDVFAKSRFIRDPIFSNLTLNQAGNVVFDFSASISPELVSFARAARSGAASTP